IMVFLFGLSYLAPWYYNVKGVLYREIFGVFSDENTAAIDITNSTNKDAGHNGSDDSFSA
ncbi:MAG: hypothetical protein MJK15_14715, partial [Colwellia sp.]|nr:hypothetical protein [Colwellia sp.]